MMSNGRRVVAIVGDADKVDLSEFLLEAMEGGVEG
jgi:hypothetical protein